MMTALLNLVPGHQQTSAEGLQESTVGVDEHVATVGSSGSDSHSSGLMQEVNRAISVTGIQPPRYSFIDTLSEQESRVQVRIIRAIQQRLNRVLLEASSDSLSKAGLDAATEWAELTNTRERESITRLIRQRSASLSGRNRSNSKVNRQTAVLQEEGEDKSPPETQHGGVIERVTEARPIYWDVLSKHEPSGVPVSGSTDQLELIPLDGVDIEDLQIRTGLDDANRWEIGSVQYRLLVATLSQNRDEGTNPLLWECNDRFVQVQIAARCQQLLSMCAIRVTSVSSGIEHSSATPRPGARRHSKMLMLWSDPETPLPITIQGGQFRFGATSVHSAADESQTPTGHLSRFHRRLLDAVLCNSNSSIDTNSFKAEWRLSIDRSVADKMHQHAAERLAIYSNALDLLGRQLPAGRLSVFKDRISREEAVVEPLTDVAFRRRSGKAGNFRADSLRLSMTIQPGNSPAGILAAASDAGELVWRFDARLARLVARLEEYRDVQRQQINERPTDSGRKQLQLAENRLFDQLQDDITDARFSDMVRSVRHHGVYNAIAAGDYSLSLQISGKIDGKPTVLLKAVSADAAE